MKEASGRQAPKLSIVLVNYKTRELLRQCLASLFESGTAHPIEVIVVDNASGDGCCQMLREQFPEVGIIANEQNLGFARGSNQGIRASSGRYVLLLNTDTIVQGNPIDTLIDFLEENPRAGVVGAKLLNEDLTLQAASKAFPTPLTALFGKQSLMTRWFPNNPLTRRYLVCLFADHARPFEVDSVGGAALMIRREVIEDVGLLDERYFMYWEDVDWCYRIKRRGWKVYYHPHAPIIHLDGKSSNPRDSKLIIAYHKGVFRLFRKHYFGSPWNPCNALAAAVLTARAALLIIVRNLGRS